MTPTRRRAIWLYLAAVLGTLVVLTLGYQVVSSQILLPGGGGATGAAGAPGATGPGIGLLGVGSGTPTVGTCGTGSGSVSGTDTTGTITTGAAATSCVLNYSTTLAFTPRCFAISSTAGSMFVTSKSTSAVTFGIGTALTGTFDYLCVQP